MVGDLFRRRLFWPILGLLLLFSVNLIEVRTLEKPGTDAAVGEAEGPREQGAEIRFTLDFFWPRFIRNVDAGQVYAYCSFIDILKWGSIIMALAFGMTLVIATGGIDLSVGSVMAISGGIAAVLVTQTEVPFSVVVAVALGACALVGVWNGVLVACVGIQPFVATLILMVAGRGVAKLICDGKIVTFDGHEAFESLYGGTLFYLPLCVWIASGLFLLTLALTKTTAVGLFIESVGNNETAGRFSGIHVRMVKILVYAYCAFCAGIAGLIDASSIQGADANKAGLMFELYAIFAVVVGGASLTGGRFTLFGSLIGAVLYQTLRTTLFGFDVPSDELPAYLAVVIISVCLLQSEEFRRRSSGLLRGIRRRAGLA